MAWSWQHKHWPNFQWQVEKLNFAEALFSQGIGMINGVSRHLLRDQQQPLSIDLITTEALDSSEIEGEHLNRDSVKSSIKRALGLKTSRRHVSASEAGIAEMMVNVYQSLEAPLNEASLCRWHRLLMNGRIDLEQIGAYRRHVEPMQIVSGPDYARKVHYEAPPSANVPAEMANFLQWFTDTARQGSQPLPRLARAAIAHLWFEIIHPFEDGNGRIGRAIAEKALAQDGESTLTTLLAKILLKRRKAYYTKLNEASKSLDITGWVVWFATVAIEAQHHTQAAIDFVIEKSKLLRRLEGQLNPRQEKALLRLCQAGPDGFVGGLSAANYRRITGASTATTTRDLKDLVVKGGLREEGERKARRYYLQIDVEPVAEVTVDDIQC